MTNSHENFRLGLAPWLKGKLLPAAMGGWLAVLTYKAASEDQTPDKQANASGMPVGSIIAFAGPTNTVPEAGGWLLCDGRVLNAREYPLLHDTIGKSWGGSEEGVFCLPDLRGRFLRGVNLAPAEGDRDPDKDKRLAAKPGGNAGNQVGSIQEDQFKRHNHPLMGSPWAVGIGTEGTRQILRFNSGKAPNNNAAEYANQVAILGEGGTETRPINAYVNWIIKVK